MKIRCTERPTSLRVCGSAFVRRVDQDHPCDDGRLCVGRIAGWQRAANKPAPHPGARPLPGGWPALASTPTLESYQGTRFARSRLRNPATGQPSPVGPIRSVAPRPRPDSLICTSDRRIRRGSSLSGTPRATTRAISQTDDERVLMTSTRPGDIRPCCPAWYRATIDG